MMNDLEIDIDRLILLVKERPVLWDKTLDIYKDRNLTKEAWSEICLDLDQDYESRNPAEKNQFGLQLAKTWNNFRDSWMKVRKKEKSYKKSGAKGSKPRKYKYNDEMSFLNKIFLKQTCNSLYEEKHDVGKNSFDNQPEITQQRLKVKEKETEPKHPISHTSSKVLPQNESVQRPTTSSRFSTPPNSSNTRGIKRKFDDSELEALEEVQSKDANMSFFKAILPFLKNFANDQILDFQIAVLMTIKTIQSQNAVPSSHTSQHYADIPVPSDNHQGSPRSPIRETSRKSSAHKEHGISQNSTQQSTSSNQCHQKSNSSTIKTDDRNLSSSSSEKPSSTSDSNSESDSDHPSESNEL